MGTRHYRFNGTQKAIIISDPIHVVGLLECRKGLMNLQETVCGLFFGSCTEP